MLPILICLLVAIAVTAATLKPANTGAPKTARFRRPA
jgi:hypothetical protein